MCMGVVIRHVKVFLRGASGNLPVQACFSKTLISQLEIFVMQAAYT